MAKYEVRYGPGYICLCERLLWYMHTFKTHLRTQLRCIPFFSRIVQGPRSGKREDTPVSLLNDVAWVIRLFVLYMLASKVQEPGVELRAS